MCRCHSEDSNHLFIHCPFSHQLWCRVIGELGCYWVSPVEASNLLQIDIGRPLSKRCKVLWRTVVPLLFGQFGLKGI
ncbi:hypothetical protein ACS0TY_000877 [Phlomoides rotata]